MITSTQSRAVPSPEAVLRGYFHAKDENRPLLLQDVFAEDARLEVSNKAMNIAFPAFTHGREAIADVLVRRFNQTYENIYSFYMARPPAEATNFSCDWLVAMSEKDTRSVRVGCGRYEWELQGSSPYLASRLHISIEVMQLLAPAQFDQVFAWVRLLSYPWSSAVETAKFSPRSKSLAEVLQYLGRNASDA